MRKYTVIDLFAGAGGLSLGFKQAGCYDIKIAYENNPVMQETYKKNNRYTEVRGDVSQADYSQIINQFGDIDVVIGGPPCQGFSNANRQKNHVISHNNMLVKEYIRAIQELNPKAFVMENVSMLKSDVHRFYLCNSDKKLVKQYNLKTKKTSLKLLSEKYYFPEAEIIVKDKKLIEKNIWPERHYSILNVIYKATKNQDKLKRALNKHKQRLLELSRIYLANKESDSISKSNRKVFRSIKQYFINDLPMEKLCKSIEKAVHIQRMLIEGNEIYDNNLIVHFEVINNEIVANLESYAVYDYLKAILGAEKSGYAIKDKVLCAADYGAPQKRKRFVIIGIKKAITDTIVFPEKIFNENNYRTVRDAIEDLSYIKPYIDVSEDKNGIKLTKCTKLSELAQELRDQTILYNHIITKTTEIALERFKAIKEGQNFHSLSNDMKSNTYTDIKRTQNTIYLRLRYDAPCGTVVNVRKSMWIHPRQNRAISVREAARLQTFPDSFIFYGSKDKQYQQVGNAVPPMLAKAIASCLLKMLNSQNK